MIIKYPFNMHTFSVLKFLVKSQALKQIRKRRSLLMRKNWCWMVDLLCQRSTHSAKPLGLLLLRNFINCLKPNKILKNEIIAILIRAS
jgi:hypothetical protein